MKQFNIVMAILILLLAACSGGQERGMGHDEMGHSAMEMDHDMDQMGDMHGSGTAEPLAPPIAGAPKVQVVASEFAFEPAELTLKAGEPINIELVNKGQLPHEFAVKAFDFHAHAEAGETVTVGFIPAESGTFDLGCYIPGHFENGMVGSLTVN